MKKIPVQNQDFLLCAEIAYLLETERYRLIAYTNCKLPVLYDLRGELIKPVKIGILTDSRCGKELYLPSHIEYELRYGYDVWAVSPCRLLILYFVSRYIIGMKIHYPTRISCNSKMTFFGLFKRLISRLIMR